MAERLDIVSQSNFPTNKSNTVEIVTTTKKKVTTASASDIATLVTPAISNLDIATQTNFPIQESDAQSDFIITTDGGVNNITAEDAAGLISSYIPTGGGDPHKPDFTADYSENYSDFSNFTGSGTEADPYQIWDEEMFLNARFKVNNGGLSDATYFKQMRDIVWQFDGIGWGMHIPNIYIYNTENTEIIQNTSYGNSTVTYYLNYNGNNNKLEVQFDGFTYNQDFVEDLVNYTEPHGKITTSNSMNIFGFTFYLLNCNKIENLELSVKGELTNQLNSIYFNFIGASIAIKNLIIKDSYYKYTSNFNLEKIIYSSRSDAILKNIKILNFTASINRNVGYVYLLHTSSNLENIEVKNCVIDDTNVFLTKNEYKKDINNLRVQNCVFSFPTSGNFLTCQNLSNSIIENSSFLSSSISKSDCNLIKADYIYSSNIKDLYIEAKSFYGFNVNYKIYGCSFLGSIWCKQLDNSGEFYLCRSVGSSTLPEGEYTVNYCKNSAVFMVDSNSYTYNLDTHAYLGADTTDSSGDSEGVVIANI